MLARLRELLLERFHKNQDGAIAILVMAGVLIVLMTAMVMYDAGESARERMDVQIGADTAALSAATVKARSMNMVTYGNITKRILYGYTTLYTAAFFALVEAVAYYTAMTIKHAKQTITYAKCAATVVGAPICLPKAIDELAATISTAIVAIKGILQLIVELLEFFAVNGPRLYGLSGGMSMSENGRSMVEVEALNLYQQYTKQLAPWWGWGEAVTRGMRNGATLVGTYPIPEGDATRLRDKINFVMSAVGSVFGGFPNLTGGALGMTTDEDKLPLEQVPEMVSLGPFLPGITAGKLYAHMKMCGRVLFSPEFWLMQYYWDHWRVSEGYWRDTSGPYKGNFSNHPAPQTMVTALEILQLPVGCVSAVGTMGMTALPFEIEVGASAFPGAQGFNSATEDNWLAATQNVVVSYKGGNDRFGHRRKKLEFMSRDYSLGGRELLYRNEGYWAISKAEMVWDPSFLGDLTNEVSSAVSNIPFFGNIMGIIRTFQNAPTMWDPRWTSRMRPFTLPNEDSSVTDLQKIYHDSLPFMVMGAPLSYLYNGGGGLPTDLTNFNPMGMLNTAIGAAQGFVQDVMYMQRATGGFDAEHLKGGFEK